MSTTSSNHAFEPLFEDTTTVAIPENLRDELAKEIRDHLENCLDSMHHAIDLPEEDDELRQLEAAIAMRRLTEAGCETLPRWAAIRAANGALSDIESRLKHDSNGIADARKYVAENDRLEAFLGSIGAL